MRRSRFLTAVICAAILTFIIVAVSGCRGSDKAAEIKAGETQAELNQSRAPGSQRTNLMVGGSGSNLPIIRVLARAFMERHPGIRVEIPESLGSTGGIKSVNEGLIDIGLTAREFLPEERGLGLKYIPYARVLLTFAVNNNVNIDNLTEEQLLGIYTAKITNWKAVGGPDHEIVVLTRELSDSSRLVWNNCLKGFENAGNLPEAVLLRTDQAMNEAITSIPYSIGWTDLGAVTLEYPGTSMLKINGVSPRYETVLNGEYPYIKELAFVTKGKPAGDALKFIEFVRGWEGTQILMDNGYMAARKDN